MSLWQLKRDLTSLDIIEGFILLVVIAGVFVIFYLVRQSTEVKIVLLLTTLICIFAVTKIIKFVQKNNAPLPFKESLKQHHLKRK